MLKVRNLALAVVGSALAFPALAQTTLTFSTWVPPTHHLSVWQQQLGRRRREGHQRPRQVPDAAEAPAAPPGTFDAVKDGLVDVSYVTASYTPARHVLPLLPELPGGGATAEINSVAFSRIHWKYLQPVGEYKGVKLLGVFTHGPGQMFNTKQPINKVEDLSGHEDPLRRRHLRRDGARARRLGLRQAGAGILRAAELRRRRRHVLPARVDHLLQARHGDRHRPRCSPAASTAPRSASS